MKIFVKIASCIVSLLVFVWCAVLVSRPIDLSTADLGRHIKNGEIILHGSTEDRYAVLHTNFYSYTNTDESFINHHWGSGVFFYLVHHSFGFKGDSVAYIILMVLAFLPFYIVAQRLSGTAVAVFISILALPVIASRKEVRPEVFSYLFSGIYYSILFQYIRKGYLQRWQNFLLLCIPLTMVMWVNLHIGFIVGIGIVGVFWLGEIISRVKTFGLRISTIFQILDTKLSVVLVATILASLISPFGVSGLLYPLNIFRKYGYMIVENQSISFLEKLHITSGMNFGFFYVLVGVVAISFIAVFIKQYREYKKDNDQEYYIGIKIIFVHVILCTVFGMLAGFAIRNFPLFGLFVIPSLAYNISVLMPKNMTSVEARVLIGAFFVLSLGFFIRIYGDVRDRGDLMGIGLSQGVMGAGQFYIQENIQGPIFNNYDIGGYLIYYLGGIQKVFVDNRPEAYPVAFFQDSYISSQENQQKWDMLNTTYRFNSIFFNYHDQTPWAQTFLTRMVQDPLWVPVFVDNYNIIFVRRSPENEELIQKFEIPKSRFGITGN